ncbi:MAG: VWA domain-containing protein [Treponema sp.]|nr:VWA domain-containing protein [Treponema sp.]
MNFSCARPIALLGLLAAIPLLIFRLVQISKLDKKIKQKLAVKTFLNIGAFCMLCLAFANISWGNHLIPVQKNGSAVSFVFDISNSMNANDGPDGLSRMEASAIYAKKLLNNMEGTSVSVVLAKGDGIAAIPLTEDFVLIESLLEVLSPGLMTAPGSSLGKGILTAKDSFSTNFSTAGKIWLFTDGEETDSALQNALSECIKTSIPVTIIGFGQETEIPVLAGDGKTLVNSALRKDKILRTISEVEKHFNSYKNRPEINFVDSSERGSAAKLLSQLKNNSITTYETKPVPRFKFFIILAMFFFAAGFFITEFNFSLFKKMNNKIDRKIDKLGNKIENKISRKITKSQNIMMILLVIPFFICGCSKKNKDVLMGTYAYTQQQYQHSISLFMQALEDSKAEENQKAIDFCLYDIGTAYLKLEEDSAALEKFSKISEDAPNNLKYRAYYNAGIIAHQNSDYEKAADFFRKALQADNSKIDAKINLELSIQQQEVNVKNNQNQSTPASEEKSRNSDLEKAVFERIKENDRRQWKSSESSQEKNLSDDF